MSYSQNSPHRAWLSNLCLCAKTNGDTDEQNGGCFFKEVATLTGTREVRIEVRRARLEFVTSVQLEFSSGNDRNFHWKIEHCIEYWVHRYALLPDYQMCSQSSWSALCTVHFSRYLEVQQITQCTSSYRLVWDIHYLNSFSHCSGSEL